MWFDGVNELFNAVLFITLQYSILVKGISISVGTTKWYFLLAYTFENSLLVGHIYWVFPRIILRGFYCSKKSIKIEHQIENHTTCDSDKLKRPMFEYSFWGMKSKSLEETITYKYSFYVYNFKYYTVLGKLMLFSVFFDTLMTWW
jgi:hypothetical protein